MSTKRILCALPILILAALPLSASPAAAQTTVDAVPGAVPADVVRIASNNSFDDTVVRLKADVAAKGIRLFDQIDQSGLGAAANAPIPHSTLVIFGNPPLGVQFLQSTPYAGLDWPVRMLVFEDASHHVWIAWTSFDAIARRYAINDKAPQLKMASAVAASIAAAAAGKQP